MLRSRLPLFGLLFVSGACSLVYETVWIRELRLVFGAQTSASAVVIACFMGGLGIGGLWLGKYADRHAGSLKWYAFLEAVTALGAAVTPLLLGSVRWAYIEAGGSRTLGEWGGTMVRVALSALVFAVPTVAMGGTLSAATRAVGAHSISRRRIVALLYAVNALGAATGCFLATFLLFEALGTRASLLLGCAVNTIVAIIAWALSRWPHTSLSSRQGKPNVAARELDSEPRRAERMTTPRSLVLAAAGVSGFVFCLTELVWYRTLTPLLGGSVFTFGLILAVALAGLALGSALYAAGPDRTGTRAFAWTCLLQAFFLAAPRACGDRIAVFAAIVRPVAAMGFAVQTAEWAFIASLVVFFAAVAAGMQFPLLIRLLGADESGTGRDVGDAYAVNTAGAIAGSLTGGFGLIPAIGADGSWRVLIALLVTLGGAALAFDVYQSGRKWGAIGPALFALLTAISLSFAGPTAAWRDSPVGAALVDPNRLRTPNDVQSWLFERRRAIDWQADGRESRIAIDSANGVSFVVNGKNDGNARGDAATTVMLGLLGAFLHPHPTRAMVVGLGTGASAGWLAAVPSINDVDVGELEPSVLEVARRSAPINHGALDNPKLHITFGDAREMLLTSKTRYDLVASEPSNPYRAGVASLFTREFYEAAKTSLEEDGFFLQWVQGYEVDAQTVRTIYATLASVFPVVESWHLKSDDLLLVASRHPPDFNVPRLRSRMTEEPFRSAFALAWRTTELEGVLAHYLAGDRMARRVAEEEGAALNTDDRNRVEFGFARCLTGDALFSLSEIGNEARKNEDGTPSLHGGAVDGSHVDEAGLAIFADEGLPIERNAAERTPGVARRIAALNAFQMGDNRRAAAEWARQSQEPANPTELAIVGTAIADTGNEAAVQYIDAIRKMNNTEADVTLARLRFRQGQADASMTALETAYAGYRVDPWPLPGLMLRALSMSVELLASDPLLAERMWHALEEPFSLRLGDEVRRKVAAYAAKLLPAGAPCIEATEALEPNPVWTEEFLRSRADCYEAVRSPRAESAQDDLRRFLQNAPAPFALSFPHSP